MFFFLNTCSTDDRKQSVYSNSAKVHRNVGRGWEIKCNPGGTPGAVIQLLIITLDSATGYGANIILQLFSEASFLLDERRGRTSARRIDYDKQATLKPPMIRSISLHQYSFKNTLRRY